jgi:hypothetical protein
MPCPAASLNWCVSDLIEAALPELGFPKDTIAMDLEVFRVADPDACCSSGGVDAIVSNNHNIVRMHWLLSDLQSRSKDQYLIFLYVRPIVPIRPGMCMKYNASKILIHNLLLIIIVFL